jgi:protocatechuate 3,4-dioxygenase beta subunit
MEMLNVLLLFPLFLADSIGLTLQTESCAVEGTVYSLTNNTPLPGAEVTISRTDNATTPPVVLTTDAAGHYELQDIVPGHYSISASHQGYVPQVYGARRRNHKGITLVLSPRVTLRRIDFRLDQTGVIVGKVLNENGDPITDATVQALTPRYVEGERTLIGGVAPTKTNDLGEYRIYGLAPDRYYIGVSGQSPDQVVLTRPKGGLRELRNLPTLYPNVGDIDHATMIDVPPSGNVRGIDIVVSKSGTFHIRGKIAGFGPAYQYAQVQLQAAGVRWEIGRRSAEIAPDAQGNFDFGGVIPGSYLISTTFFRGSEVLGASRLVHLQDADLNDVNLFASEGVVRGHVRVDGLQKINLTKLRIHLRNSYSLPLEGVVASDGSFDLRAFGHYPYQVRISGPEDFYLKSARMGDQELSDRIVDLSNTEEPVGLLEIVLGADGGRVNGVVLTDDGAPVKNAVVVLIPDLGHRHETDLFKNTTTDQNGQFAMHGIKPGSYKLFAWDDVEPGIWWDPQFLKDYEDKGEEVEVEVNAVLNRSVHVLPTNAP